jgi:CHAT domain-containing protein/Tfp pilus assembly protein PilF
LPEERVPVRWLARISVGAFAALAVIARCGSGPTPESLFTEAEHLRFRCERRASEEAITRYQQAMSAWEKGGQHRDAARAGQGLGATYDQLGLLDDSLGAFQSALLLAQRSSDKVLESEIASAVGTARARTADGEAAFAEAREECQRALKLARRSGSKGGEASALSCLGEVAYYQFRPEEALGHYLSAGRLWEETGDRSGEAQSYLYRGHVYSDQSQFDQARDSFERAQSLWANLGDKRGRAITLVGEARLLMRQGEYQEALNTFQSALELLRPMGDAVWEGSCLTGIARVYLDMGEVNLALTHWERAHEIFDRVGLKHIAVDVLISLGETYLASGDDSRALSRLEQALPLTRELGVEWWQAAALRLMGVVYLFRQQPGQALAHLERSLELQLRRSFDDPGLEAETRADLGEVLTLRGESDLATQRFREALDLSRIARDRVTEARGFFGLARTSARAGDLDTARQHVERALTVVESLRTATEHRDLRTSYLASVHHYSEFHTDVLMRLHRARLGAGLDTAAFEASERARARSLLDRLAEAGVDLRQGVDPALLKRERDLKIAFQEWARRQRGDKHAEDSESLGARYRELEERFGQLQAEIRSRSPRYAALVQPEPLSLAEVQEEVLDEETLLLEYALGEERSYLWAVQKGSHSSFELPPRAHIEEAAQRAYERLTARLSETGSRGSRLRRIEEADAEYWIEARRLSGILLAPVAEAMAGKRILVVADGALQYLPFAALPVPGRLSPVPMVVEHEIVNLPSASVLAVQRRERRGRAAAARTVAVLADPVYEHDDPRLAASGVGGRAGGPDQDAERDGSQGFPRLAATRREAASIVAAAPRGTTLQAVGFDASRTTALSPEVARYGIVHFAAHGVFDNENPGRSGIVLSMFDRTGQAQDGFLRLHDIYALDLPAEVVVMSACDTALGKQVRGEGLVGMVRGFMHAGAERVVASLWKVDDEATGELMRQFYVEMLQNDRSPAAALREAQVALRTQRRWHSPFYWAAFVLQGEWR